MNSYQPRSINLVLVLFSLLITSSCGSRFIKGWRSDSEDQRTAEERCAAREGYSWVNNACTKNTEITLTTPDECAKLKDFTWGKRNGVDVCMPVAEAECLAVAGRQYVGEKCLTQPPLELTGAPLTQTVSAGSAIQPLDIKTSAGAKIELRDVTPSCEGFFKIEGAKVISTAADLKNAAAKTCEVNVIAKLGGAESVPQHITVAIEPGFLGYCTGLNDPQREAELKSVRNTIIAMKVAVKKPDCAEADKALQSVVELDLSTGGTSGIVITDLTPLAGLTKLAWLHLEGNEVTNLKPLAPLSHLEYIGMRGNPLGFEVPKTEENCPTSDSTAPGVRDFCRAKGN